MHGGHRERVKERFLNEGLSAFTEIQALELLLFYSIPRVDTNPIAHLLLDRFGSLRNVFEADAADIAAIPGIGINSALLIKLLPEITRKFWIDGTPSNPSIKTIEEAVNFIKPILFAKPVEHVYVFCLDNNYRMKHYNCISQGTINDATIYLRKVVECAMRLNSNKIILAHNHPGGHPSPSDVDIKTTRSISNALGPIGIELVDHIIFSGHDYYSFAQKHIIDKNYPSDIAGAAQTSYFDPGDKTK